MKVLWAAGNAAAQSTLQARAKRSSRNASAQRRVCALRFPRVVRLREDKRAEDTTTEAELVELAHLAERTPGNEQQRKHSFFNFVMTVLLASGAVPTIGRHPSGCSS